MSDTVVNGSLAQAGTRTFVIGAASGLNTAAIIDAGFQSRTLDADRNDIRISNNDARVTAYQELQTLGQNMQAALEGVRKQYSSLNDTSNLFDQRHIGMRPT